MRILAAAGLCCLLGSGALAQSPEATAGSITTHATARARLANTVADAVVAVAAHAATVAGVQKALANGSEPLLAYLRGAGAERIRTEQVAVTPDTDAPAGRPDRIVGYSGRVAVSFRVPAERLGETLSGALGKGGNTIESTVLAPRESEVDAARQELASEAVRTALAQARAVGEAAGRHLGAVRQIVVDPGLGLPRPLPAFAARSMAVAAAPIPTEAGQSEVAATVSVVVSLIEP